MKVEAKCELAVDDEMVSLMENQMWDLVELPESKHVLHNKWFYQLKEENNGTRKYKARLVVKEFQRRESVDFIEIFSHVVKLTTIRSVLSIMAAEDLHLEQLDVKTAFFHGDLEDRLIEQLANTPHALSSINHWL